MTDDRSVVDRMTCTGRTRSILILVMVVGLLLRMLPLICSWDYPNTFMQYDSWGYHRIAQNLLDGNGYSWNEQAPYDVNVYRPPGLPLILLAVYTVAGPSIPHAILLQVLFSAAVVGMTYYLTKLLVGERAAMIAAVLQAVEPLSITYSNILLTEALSSLILICTVYVAAKYVKNKTWWLLPVLGTVLAAGILIHPILLLLPLLATVLPLCSADTRRRRHILAACAALVIGLLPASCWVARNTMVADYAGISCVTAVNILKYKAAGVMAELNGTTLLDEANRLTDECEAELPPDATRGERWRAWHRKGRSIVLAHPLIYGKLHIRGMLKEFFGPGRDNLVRLLYGGARVLDAEGQVTDQSIRAAVRNDPVLHLDAIRYGALGIQALTFAMFALGCIYMLVKRRFALAIGLLIPIAYVLALSGGPEAFSRFRVIYMPFVCITAALGLDLCVECGRKLGLRHKQPIE